MHQRGKMAAEPLSDAAACASVPCPFFFSFPIRAESAEKHYWRWTGRLKKKGANAPFGRNNKTLKYLTRFIRQLSLTLCAPLLPSPAWLSISPLSQTHSVTQSHSPILQFLCITLGLGSKLTSPTHSQLRYQTKAFNLIILSHALTITHCDLWSDFF